MREYGDVQNSAERDFPRHVNIPGLKFVRRTNDNLNANEVDAFEHFGLSLIDLLLTTETRESDTTK